MKQPIICSECLAELPEWETVYNWENEWICEDCFKAKVDELTIVELAELLDVETRVVSDFMYKEE